MWKSGANSRRTKTPEVIASEVTEALVNCHSGGGSVVKQPSRSRLPGSSVASFGVRVNAQSYPATVTTRAGLALQTGRG